MSKRKHSEITNDPPSSSYPSTDKTTRLQRLQFSGLLDQGKTSLFRALKVARGFERQKLGRRQKTAKAEEKESEIKRLDAEILALKGLDLASTAEVHLYKIILKIKSIAAAPSLPHYVHDIVDASRKKPLDTAAANVQARLFKSTPVQESMESSLKSIRKLLGVAEVTEGHKKKRLRAKDYQHGNEAKEQEASFESPEREFPSQAEEGAEEWDGISGSDSALSIQDPQDNDISSDEYDHYNSRLAASSDSDSDSDPEPSSQSADSDIETSRPPFLNPRSITPESSDLDNDPSQDPPTRSNSISPPPSPDPNPAPKFAPQKSKTTLKPSKTTRPSSSKPTSTTFLPTLSFSNSFPNSLSTTHGYISGSSSPSSSRSHSPSSINNPSNPDLQPRKNRRGQQARRALWEKKFGKNARHVRLDLGRDKGKDVGKGRGKGGRDEGWDVRRGAMGGGEGRGRGNARGRAGGRGPERSGANSEVVGGRRRGELVKSPGVGKSGSGIGKGVGGGGAGEKLHPSWEAAKRAKEMQAKMPAFQGKKVVF